MILESRVTSSTMVCRPRRVDVQFPVIVRRALMDSALQLVLLHFRSTTTTTRRGVWPRLFIAPLCVHGVRVCVCVRAGSTADASIRIVISLSSITYSVSVLYSTVSRQLRHVTECPSQTYPYAHQSSMRFRSKQVVLHVFERKRTLLLAAAVLYRTAFCLPNKENKQTLQPVFI